MHMRECTAVNVLELEMISDSRCLFVRVSKRPLLFFTSCLQKPNCSLRVEKQVPGGCLVILQSRPPLPLDHRLPLCARAS